MRRICNRGSLVENRQHLCNAHTKHVRNECDIHAVSLQRGRRSESKSVPEVPESVPVKPACNECARFMQKPCNIRATAPRSDFRPSARRLARDSRGFSSVWEPFQRGAVPLPVSFPAHAAGAECACLWSRALTIRAHEEGALAQETPCESTHLERYHEDVQIIKDVKGKRSWTAAL